MAGQMIRTADIGVPGARVGLFAVSGLLIYLRIRSRLFRVA